MARGSGAARNSGHHKLCVRPDTAITVAAHPQNDVNSPLIRTFISVALHASLFLLVGEISAKPAWRPAAGRGSALAIHLENGTLSSPLHDKARFEALFHWDS